VEIVFCIFTAQNPDGMPDSQSIGNKIITFFFFLVLLSMGFKESINSAANILFLSSALIWGDYGFLRSTLRKHTLIWWFSLLFLAYIVGVFYSVDVEDAWRRVAIKLMLVLWPLGLVLAWPRLEKRNVFKIVTGVPFLLAIATLIRAFSRYFGSGDFAGNSEVFRYYRLAAFSMHPNYLMLFLGGAIVALWWYRRKKMLLFGKLVDQTLWWGLLLYCFIFLQARTGFFFLLIILSAATIYWEGKQYLRNVKSRVLYPLVALLLYFLLPDSFIQRYRVDTSTEFVEESNKDTSFSGRLVIWNHCLWCAKQNPVFGQGTGDAVAFLHQRFEDVDFKAGVRDKYNCHNQYLETLLSLGLFGLILLLGIPFSVLRKFSRKDIALLAFILFYFAGIFFESVLERHKGVMVLAIFSAVFLLQSLSEEKNFNIESNEE
jgi:O-antigen ligase